MTLRGGVPGETPWERASSPRSRLFGAAVAVVVEKGYHATSVADIAEFAEVSRATFYKHFPDKQACVLATADALGAGAGRIVAVPSRRCPRPTPNRTRP